jgi:hypothetical protein
MKDPRHHATTIVSRDLLATSYNPQAVREYREAEVENAVRQRINATTFVRVTWEDDPMGHRVHATAPDWRAVAEDLVTALHTTDEDDAVRRTLALLRAYPAEGEPRVS